MSARLGVPRVRRYPRRPIAGRAAIARMFDVPLSMLEGTEPHSSTYRDNPILLPSICFDDPTLISPLLFMHNIAVGLSEGEPE